MNEHYMIAAKKKGWQREADYSCYVSFDKTSRLLFAATETQEMVQ